jgi:hypothetical protein
MKKLRKLAWVKFEPSWWKNSPAYHDKHPLKFGEDVIYLGDIPNSTSHCVVVTESGKVIPIPHTADFRELTEDET